MDEERELKKAIKSGEPERIRQAFESFYNLNVRLVYRVLIDSYGKDTDTDDDVQESFLSLIEKADSLPNIDHIADYWVKSAVYICGHRLKKKARFAQDQEDEIPSSDRSIPELLQGDELFETVEKTLGYPDSDIVILRATHGYSERELAKRFGMSEDAIYRRYKKGLKALKGRLDHEKK